MEHNKLRNIQSSEEVENNWAISYGDMITLLLGFFVIFFNIKNETMNLQLVHKDITKYFETSDGRGPSAIAGTGGKEQQRPGTLTETIAAKLKVKANIDGEKIIIEFPNTSFFDSSAYELNETGKAALTEFSNAIKDHLGLFRLVVRGYTDIKPVNPGARYKDNLELSAFRSISAIRYLANQGIRMENMRIAGFGESSMSRESLDVKDLSQQRKVVIVIEPLDHTERAFNKLMDNKTEVTQ